MKITLLGFIFITLVAFVSSSADAKQNLPDGYDPNRDPHQDLEMAKSVSHNRKILLIVGGEWCKWCTILDNYFKENQELHKNLEDIFVIVKVHYSEENKNSAFLSDFPKINSVPHFIILRNDGTYIGEQKTEVLESAESYSNKSFEKFIDYWRWR